MREEGAHEFWEFCLFGDFDFVALAADAQADLQL